ncbi:MAG: NINE protein, partial [Phycisphaerae bacterium]|nr:NINE protein [Phycisphaerae bacterium]
YALGVMLYEMLLGRVPYQGATMGEVLMKHLTAQPEVDELPAPFPEVIRKALAKDPSDRFASVQDMVNAVFATQDLERSVATFEPASITHAAASAAKRLRTFDFAHAHADGGGGWGPGGSSAVSLDAQGTPPVVERRAAARQAPSFDRGRDDGASADVAVQGRYNVPTFPQRDRLTVGMLGLFLGPLGVHRFYTGHVAIGVWQILATLFSAGFAGLWGIIEGIMVLSHSDYRDSLGRPLISIPPQPGQRWRIARLLWGGLAFVAVPATLVFLIVGTVAPPEMEPARVGLNQTHYVNLYHIMYGAACFTAGLAAFAAWKAGHRGGLPFWSATTRPALMTGGAVMAGAGVVFELFFAAGGMQLAGIGFSMLGLSVVLIAWLLRGPQSPPLPGDDYWHRALRNVFVLIAMAAAVGLIFCARSMSQPGYAFERDCDPLHKLTITREGWVFSAKGNEYQSRDVEYPVAAVCYRQEPLALAALLVLLTGAANEARYRRRAAEQAERQFTPAA